MNTILHLKTKEQRFWDWFQTRSEQYFMLEENQDNLFHELRQRLAKISRNLTFEFSALRDDGVREFVISADGIRRFFPIVIKLVRSAPTIPGWKIIAFRQPKVGYEKITYKDLTLRFDDVFFRYGKDHGKLGLELNIRGFKDHPDWIIISFLLLDMVVGEYDTEVNISWIDRKPLNESALETLFPLSELPGILKTHKDEMKSLLTDRW